jgi:flagellar basal-body rod modification protein FlgD
MAEGVSGMTPAGWATPGDTPAKEAQVASSEVDKEMFLQLLVAQIKHQDPMNPADGVEFLTQLAEFTNLEQIMGVRKELEGIHTSIDTYASAALEGNESGQVEDEG